MGKKCDTEVIELTPKIYWVSVDNKFDLAMLFLRPHEWYESPNPRFKGKKFTIMEYIEWYSKDWGNNVFTYTKNWTGFIVTPTFFGRTYKQYLKWYNNIPDPNKYDKEFKRVVDACYEHRGSVDFYLMGARPNDKSTLLHEVAHGLYYTNPMYKSKMNMLTDKLPKKQITHLKKVLVDDMGYASTVVKDEIQAYMATGLTKEFDGPLLEKHRDQYIKIFNQYNTIQPENGTKIL